MGNKCSYESKFLPLPLWGEAEMELSNWIRAPLYLLGLVYTFLGIAIISDIFMAGIEKVTSLKKRVKDKTSGRTVTVQVWNATVANLTLMALGSSAPEILLSIIEVVGDDMFLGDLGTGTIVGSAAFNLLCISAVCVLAIDDGEHRKIKEVPVYVITASFSVFAYLWLIIVLMAPPSPDVCETWEAVMTLLFFPLLITLAYLADRGYFALPVKGAAPPRDRQMLQVIPENVTKDELVQIEQQIRETHGTQLTSEQVVSIMTTTYFTQRSRAYYRRAALQSTLGMKKVNVTQVATPEFLVAKMQDSSDTVEADRMANVISVGFACARYAFLENCGHATLTLTRSGPTHVWASVKYQTRDGTAKEGSDFEKASGTITFEKEETTKTLVIKIHDDNAYEDNEEFYVDLTDTDCGGREETNASIEGCSPPCTAVLGLASATVVIIDDDEPGGIRFVKEEVIVDEGVEEKVLNIFVERFNGASGTIGCKFHTEDMGAVEGMDYKEATGKLMLGPAIQSFMIPIPIMPKGRYEKTSGFNVILTEPTGCKFDKDTDGGEEKCICHVVIQGHKTEERTNLLRKMESRIHSHQVELGQRHWREQFRNALCSVSDEEDEEGEGPTKMDYAVHIVSLPWKLLFAFVPPVDFLDGWACFIGALCMIAAVTALVGDMANLVGCTMNINPEITAITFVALGTSLPDTFASKAAASMDPYADASIGNITGSNSVNVFLGLGISWTVAAFYWESRAPTDLWLQKVRSPGGAYYGIRDNVEKIATNSKAVFVVPAGSVWFNLLVFVINAFFAIAILFARRRKFGGELGGPKRGFLGQYFSACFLVFQWVIYITASSIYSTMKES